MDPSASRTMWQALEPIHAMIYFAPEAQEEYAGAGLDVSDNWAAGYFPARAAPMGAVGAAVVESTFYNFSPAAVHAGIDGVWDLVAPTEVLAARHRGAVGALRRLCGAQIDAPATAEAADLARQALAGASTAGRPLFAAHAALAWPDDPVLALWHAAGLLREYRGDGHIAALVTEGYSGLDAVVTYGVAAGPKMAGLLRKSRGYTEEEWAAGVDDLRDRGWLDTDGEPTGAGTDSRQRVEDLTDRLALPAWEVLGADGCDRLAALAQPLSEAIIDARGVPGRRR